jgi:hypothetical protein
MAFVQRYLILTVLVLLVFVPCRGFAQQLSDAPVPGVQFRVVAMTDVASVLYDVEKKQEVVNAGVGTFSRIYDAPKNREVVLYTEIPNPDPSLPPAKVVVAKALLPAGKAGPFLIMLNKNPPGSEHEFSSLVIDHSLETHPIKTYLVFNFSKRRLAVSLAEKNLVLTTGASDLVSYPDSRKAWLKVAADEKSDGWLLVSSSPHAVGTDTRTTIFLVDIPPSPLDPNPKGIVARRIRETVYTDDSGVQHIR